MSWAANPATINATLLMKSGEDPELARNHFPEFVTSHICQPDLSITTVSSSSHLMMGGLTAMQMLLAVDFATLSSI
jgi:hypothetical protein